MRRRFYWCNAINFGDRLTPIVFGHFIDASIERASEHDTGKILGIGSILWALRENDIVLGSGTFTYKSIRSPNGVRFLAVRGPLTRALIAGAKVPEIYGDPALLMPLVYRPSVQKRYKVGYVPHYVDKTLVWDVRHCICGLAEITPCVYCRETLGRDATFVDIQADWRKVVEGVLSCEMIITSSLHGLICAEAYGVPVIWKRYSNNIIGGDLKFQDYFLGTDRACQRAGELLRPLANLSEIQERIITAISSLPS